MIMMIYVLTIIIQVHRLHSAGDAGGARQASQRAYYYVVLTRRVSCIFWLCLTMLMVAGILLGLCFGIDANKE